MNRNQDGKPAAAGIVEKSLSQTYFSNFMRCLLQDMGQAGQERKKGAVDRSCLSCRYVRINTEN